MIEYNALTERDSRFHELQDYRAGLICAVIANANRNPKKKMRPFTPQDFMPTKRKPMSDEQMFAQVQAINTMLGGKVEEI